MIGIILPVGYDDMIHKVNAHQFAGLLDAFRQFFIGVTG
jgi:hypothetical protein